MREVEGREIAAELGRRIDVLRKKTSELAARREEISARLLTNLRDRLAALAPDRSARFRAGSSRRRRSPWTAPTSPKSCNGSRATSSSSRVSSNRRRPVGKKLEFLSQEILRELNTLGSKAKDLQLVRDVLDMKSETEKIREQVQNVE